MNSANDGLFFSEVLDIAALTIHGVWNTYTASYISNGKQLSQPENKFGNDYKHGKKHFSTEKWTVEFVRIIRV